MSLKNGKKSNKKIGNEFENDFSDILFKNGFWNHILAQNQSGQPFDVIAGKNNYIFAFDCKVCHNDRFLLKRVEPNQDEAMSLLNELGCHETFFALKFEKHNEIYLARYEKIKNWSNTLNSLPYSFVKTWCVELNAWLELWK